VTIGASDPEHRRSGANYGPKIRRAFLNLERDTVYTRFFGYKADVSDAGPATDSARNDERHSAAGQAIGVQQDRTSTLPTMVFAVTKQGEAFLERLPTIETLMLPLDVAAIENMHEARRASAPASSSEGMLRWPPNSGREPQGVSLLVPDITPSYSSTSKLR
jgi:hypothetical protein